MLPFSLAHGARRVSEIKVSDQFPHPGNDKEVHREGTCPGSEPITCFQFWCSRYYHVLRHPFISTKIGLLTEPNPRPRDVFGEGTHESLGCFLSPVFGKVKTTTGANPWFMPVGVDITTRGILALSPAS